MKRPFVFTARHVNGLPATRGARALIQPAKKLPGVLLGVIAPGAAPGAALGAAADVPVDVRALGIDPVLCVKRFTYNADI